MSNYFDEYLKKVKFKNSLNKLKKKIKNKSCIIYGSGTFFQYINEHYNLDEFNIIGISDMKYSIEQEGDKDFGYNIVPRGCITKSKPDYVLVATENYIKIIEDLELRYFKGTNIKVLPLAPKGFVEVIKTVWNSI